MPLNHKPIKMMMNGLPGNVAANIARHALGQTQIELLPYSLTGPEIAEGEFHLGTTAIQLVHPDERSSVITDLKETHGSFISVDFTHPTAVNDNAEFYCAQALPFVMGTTGGDRERLRRCVEASHIPAVIAPNMAKQIVGLQAMMAFGGEQFPDLFKGYKIKFCNCETLIGTILHRNIVVQFLLDQVILCAGLNDIMNTFRIIILCEYDNRCFRMAVAQLVD